VFEVTDRRRRPVTLTVLLAIALVGGAWFSTCMGLKTFVYGRYLQSLSYLGIPNLPDLKHCEEGEAYRFFWWRSFHPAVLVCVFVQDDTHATLNVKVARQTEDPLRGELVSDTTRELNAAEIRALREVVASNRFWRKRIRDALIQDGSGWTIEVRQSRVYHRGSRISPKTGRIRNIGEHMLQLSGLELSPREVY